MKVLREALEADADAGYPASKRVAKKRGDIRM
jgi:hypothetical protein